jgi:hypothetical protein
VQLDMDKLLVKRAWTQIPNIFGTRGNIWPLYRF